jgi:hypothetical protein
MPSRISTLLVTALLACAPAPPTHLDADRALVSKMRSVAEARLRRKTFTAWSRWVTGKAPATAAGDEDEWLLSPSALDALRRVLRTERDHDARRALHNLHAFLVSEHLEQAVTGLDERIDAIEQESFELDGEQIAYRNLSVRLATEPDPLSRRRLAEAVGPIYSRLNPLFEQRQRAVRVAADRIGYADPIELASEVRQYDVAAAGQLAERLLASSEALYLTALRELAPTQVGVLADRLGAADLPRLSLAPRAAGRLQTDGLMKAVDRTLAGLGIRLAALSLFIDARPLPHEDRGAACFPIVVPNDVRLSIRPDGGETDYRAVMHELGRALQLVHTTTPVFELQVLGDHSVAEALAFLIEGIAEEPDWLREQLGLEEPELTRVIRLGALDRLLTIRRYAGLLLFEIEWTRGTRRRGPDLYNRAMSRAYGLGLQDADTQRYLVDRDPFLDAADTVRGWLLAAQLRQHLRERYGPRWFASEAAGAALRELWASGQRDSALEIAARLEIGPLRPEPFVADVAAALARGRP